MWGSLRGLPRSGTQHGQSSHLAKSSLSNNNNINNIITIIILLLIILLIIILIIIIIITTIIIIRQIKRLCYGYILCALFIVLYMFGRTRVRCVNFDLIRKTDITHIQS